MGFLGAILGFIGVAVLLIRDQAVSFDQNSISGYLLAFTGALLWATYSNLRCEDDSDSIVAMTIIYLFSAIVCAVLMFAVKSFLQTITTAELLVLSLLAFGLAGGGYFLWDLGLKRGNPAFLAVLGYSAPLISTILLILFGFAKLHWTVICSALFIAAGGGIFNMNRNGRVTK